MPTGKSWFNFIYVNLGFVLQIMLLYFFVAIKQIKDNWPEYRCNPIYMPLSDNIEQDFTYCIQNSQLNIMGYLLQPINAVISNITSVGADFSDSLNNARNMIGNMRGFMTNITQGIFAVFSNMIIQLQKLTLSIQDVIGKLVGVVVAMTYVLQGSMMTMNSAWAGPNGQLVRALGNTKCFHPKTLVKLEGGQPTPIRDIKIGDILQDGSKVTATLVLGDCQEEVMYSVGNVFVSGKHFVFDAEQGKFVRTKDFKGAKVEADMKCDTLISLITDTHRIVIGDNIFWDWADDELIIGEIYG